MQCTYAEISFEADHVYCKIWRHGEYDVNYFPIEFLFLDNWQEEVKKLLTNRELERLHKEEARKQNAKHDEEIRERALLKKLKEKYGI